MKSPRPGPARAQTDALSTWALGQHHVTRTDPNIIRERSHTTEGAGYQGADRLKHRVNGQGEERPTGRAPLLDASLQPVSHVRVVAAIDDG
eukprot:8738596-Pyramimonas_sp.AAC.1